MKKANKIGKAVSEWTVGELLAYFGCGFVVSKQSNSIITLSGGTVSLTAVLDTNNNKPEPTPTVPVWPIPNVPNIGDIPYEPITYNPYEMEPCRSCTNNPRLRKPGTIGDSPCQFCPHNPYAIRCYGAAKDKATGSVTSGTVSRWRVK